MYYIQINPTLYVNFTHQETSPVAFVKSGMVPHPQEEVPDAQVEWRMERRSNMLLNAPFSETLRALAGGRQPSGLLDLIVPSTPGSPG